MVAKLTLATIACFLSLFICNESYDLLIKHNCVDKEVRSNSSLFKTKKSENCTVCRTHHSKSPGVRRCLVTPSFPVEVSCFYALRQRKEQ